MIMQRCDLDTDQFVLVSGRTDLAIIDPQNSLIQSPTENFDLLVTEFPQHTVQDMGSLFDSTVVSLSSRTSIRQYTPEPVLPTIMWNISDRD